MVSEIRIFDKLNNKKMDFIKSLDGIYCRLATTAHGIGVVAIKDIPANTNPFEQMYKGEFIPIDPKDLESQTDGIKKMIRDFCPLQDGLYYVPEDGLGCIDVSFYLNHSGNPNMRCKKEGLDFFTIRDIKEGEEMTVDYNMYDDQIEDFK